MAPSKLHPDSCLHAPPHHSPHTANALLVHRRQKPGS